MLKAEHKSGIRSKDKMFPINRKQDKK